VSGRLCAVSVDLDEIDQYRAIHDLPPRDVHAVYDVALARIEAFARAEAIPLTLFAIGRDIARPRSAEGLRRLSRAGHVVENHSLSHRYDLARVERAVMEAEVRGGADAIEAVTGRRPRGFRSPGYAMCDALLDVLDRLGVAFDASLLPSPAYFGAKLAALGWQAVTGRTSHAVVHDPRTMVAPRTPYRPARPWHRRGGAGVVELPMSVTPLLRLPFIGTAVTMAGERGARALARACASDAFVSFELHGIDFLDAGDGLEELLGHQPDVRVPLDRKVRALGAALAVLRSAGHRFVTLEDVCAQLSARRGDRRG
jgi:hypothetical protein